MSEKRESTARRRHTYLRPDFRICHCRSVTKLVASQAPIRTHLLRVTSTLDGHEPPPPPMRVGTLCVPITSSTSCDQAIFVDHATDVSLFSDAVQVEVDRLG